MKKFVCLFLALIMLVCTLSACNGGGDENQGTEGNTNQQTGPVGNENESDDEPALIEPERENLGDGSTPEEIIMLVRNHRYSYLYVDSEITSDAVEKVVFERNAMIEEYYNVVFDIREPVSDTASNFTVALQNSQLGDYDLICWDYWYALDQTGLLYNLQTLDEINGEDEWWYDGWNRSVTINGKQFSIVGDAALEVLENLEVIFFNKGIAEDRDLGLYDLVDDDAWDVDAMMRVNTDVAQNLDDDDKTNDFWGALYDLHSMRSALFSAGLKMVNVADSGAIAINSNHDYMIQACDKVAELIGSAEVEYSGATARSRDISLFTDQNALFMASCLWNGKRMKTMEMGFDFGILPMPKLNAQADYISTTYGASVFSLPAKLAEDESGVAVHEAAVILNALNHYSHKSYEDGLVYTFYEEVIKGRVADMPEDAEMIDIARNAIYVDFGFVHTGIGMFGSIESAVIAGSTVSRVMATLAQNASIKIADLLEIYMEEE